MRPPGSHASYGDELLFRLHANAAPANRGRSRPSACPCAIRPEPRDSPWGCEGFQLWLRTHFRPFSSTGALPRVTRRLV